MKVSLSQSFPKIGPLLFRWVIVCIPGIKLALGQNADYRDRRNGSLQLVAAGEVSVNAMSRRSIQGATHGAFQKPVKLLLHLLMNSVILRRKYAFVGPLLIPFSP